MLTILAGVRSTAAAEGLLVIALAYLAWWAIYRPKAKRPWRDPRAQFIDRQRAYILKRAGDRCEAIECCDATKLMNSRCTARRKLDVCHRVLLQHEGMTDTSNGVVMCDTHKRARYDHKASESHLKFTQRGIFIKVTEEAWRRAGCDKYGFG